MENRDLKVLVRNGSVEKCVLRHQQHSDADWIVEITTTAGHTYALRSQRSVHPRVFKSLPAAANAARGLGLLEMQVVFSGEEKPAPKRKPKDPAPVPPKRTAKKSAE